ncbi:hypothetical protein Q8F55_009213 [Vanrija albida]|uniref:MARVEL domain-containing protein n=1 Tax=Vanrija albida TaxID=181172 RepID=A0ABR3PT20_9TREE
MSRKLQLCRASFCAAAVLALALLVLQIVSAVNAESKYKWAQTQRYEYLRRRPRARSYIFSICAAACTLVYAACHVVVQRVRPNASFLYTVSDAILCNVLGALVIWSGLQDSLKGELRVVSVIAIIVTSLLWLAIFSVIMVGWLVSREQTRLGRVTSKDAWFMTVEQLSRGEQFE